MESNPIETIKGYGVPTWLIAVAIASAALFFIYRNIRETQLLELQIKKLKAETGNA